MEKQTLKKMWVCQGKDQRPDCYTITYTKDASIGLLLGDSGLSWEYCQSIGYECVEVDITFEPIKTIEHEKGTEL
jgi:hypothetical protein